VKMHIEGEQGAVRRKILLVDDSPENISVLLEVLKADYQIIAARDGVRALQMAAQSPPPDLIMLDVMMPEMDGYEVCLQLKRGEQTRDIPVIFVTALAEDVNEERGFDVGAVDYITKPISPAIVRARIRTHLALKDAQRRLERQNQALIEAAQLREDVERIMQHDLKGPLTTIIGMPTLLLKKENITSQQKETLNLIREAGYLMLGMINSSLDLYKMETGSYYYNPQRIDLVQVVRKVFVECHNLSVAHDITLRLYLDGGDVSDEEHFFVVAEELLSHTMLSNLIKNAVEASPPGEEVDVHLSNDGGVPTIRIHNRGEVPVEIRGRFFDKYVTHGKQSGTGLGTYSAYMAAKTQGGDVSLDSSEPGQTVVTIRLNGE